MNVNGHQVSFEGNGNVLKLDYGGGYNVNALGWPKCLFGFFHKTLQKNSNKLFGQPNIKFIELYT